MRTIKLFFIIPCLLFVFSACKKDNYDEPNTSFSGALIDAETNGTLSLSQNGTGDGVIRFLVNNPAKYPAPGNNDMGLFADGTFKNTFFFAERYKVWPQSAGGPWLYTKTKGTVPAWAAGAPVKPDPLKLAGDTADVTLQPGSGNAPIIFKVYPYFRLTLSMVDTLATITITRSEAANINSGSTPIGGLAASAPNQLNNDNNLILYVNNVPIVNGGTSGRASGYYTNQWRFTVTTTTANLNWSSTSAKKTITFGTPFTLPVNDFNKINPVTGLPDASQGPQVIGVRWAVTHLPKGTYYWRASIFGAGSNNKSNWSNTVQAVVH